MKPSISNQPQKLQLLPSLYGSRKPPVPFAQSVTIARVASPISIKRAYEASFHRALQQYFQSEARLVKKGDIIAVAIDPMERLEIRETDDSKDAENDKPITPNEFVFFLITYPFGDSLAYFSFSGSPSLQELLIRWSTL